MRYADFRALPPRFAASERKANICRLNRGYPRTDLAMVEH